MEWWLGASPGKLLFGLRVVSADGTSVVLWRAAARATIVLVVILASDFLGALSPALDVPDPLMWVLRIALLASTARKSNGYRGLHEVLSGTRTVRVDAARTVAPRRHQSSSSRPPISPASVTIGGFAVCGRVWERDGEALDDAWDASLHRPIWIHHVDESAAAPSVARQALSRRTRLRWLASRRSGVERWDAYEAPEGRSLGPEPWETVLAMLGDLATECERALADGTAPAIVGVDHVWMSSDGVARLTEFSTGRLMAAPVALCDLGTAQTFLHTVAVDGLGGDLSRVALPLSVRAVIDRLDQRTFATFPELIDALAATRGVVMQVSRRRRLIELAGAGALAVIGLVTVLNKIPAAYALHQQPEVERFGLVLNRLLFLEGSGRISVSDQWMSHHPSSRYTAPEREAFLIYIGDRYANVIADEPAWELLDRYWGRGDRIKAAAERSKAAARSATPEARRLAGAHAASILADLDQRAAERPSFWMDQILRANADWTGVLFPLAVLSVGAAIVFRGSIVLRMFGFGIAGPDGRRASWMRAFARTVVAWSPVLLTWLAVRFVLGDSGVHSAVGPSLQTISNLTMVAGAIAAHWNPNWSIHDRIAGTRIVPS